VSDRSLNVWRDDLIIELSELTPSLRLG